MLIASHPAPNQLVGVMLGMALVVGDMTNAWQEQHLPILHMTASVGAKVAPGATRAADTHPVRRGDPVMHDRGLILVAQAGNTIAIQSLLAEGASPKACDADGRTALIAAVMAHMGATARLLVQAGADVNLQDNTQNNTFLLAVNQGGAETVRLIPPHGANLRVTNADGDTTLIPVARRDCVEVVSELVKAGVPPDATNNLDLTALIEAVALGDSGGRYEKTV